MNNRKISGMSSKYMCIGLPDKIKRIDLTSKISQLLKTDKTQIRQTNTIMQANTSSLIGMERWVKTVVLKIQSLFHRA